MNLSIHFLKRQTAKFIIKLTDIPDNFCYSTVWPLFAAFLSSPLLIFCIRSPILVQQFILTNQSRTGLSPVCRKMRIGDRLHSDYEQPDEN
jgi:hypothetical protein